MPEFATGPAQAPLAGSCNDFLLLKPIKSDIFSLKVLGHIDCRRTGDGTIPMHRNQSFSPLPTLPPPCYSRVRHAVGIIPLLLFVAGALSIVPNSSSNSNPAT